MCEIYSRLTEIDSRLTEIDSRLTEIDSRLTEININELVNQVGVPLNYISDEEIAKCLNEKIFLTTNCIYNKSCDIFSYKNDHTFDLIKITTIVNEINNNTYNYNYPIIIWDDGDDNQHKYDTDDNGLYHIRAFYYCKKNIYMSVNRSG